MRTLASGNLVDIESIAGEYIPPGFEWPDDVESRLLDKDLWCGALDNVTLGPNGCSITRLHAAWAAFEPCLGSDFMDCRCIAGLIEDVIATNCAREAIGIFNSASLGGTFQDDLTASLLTGIVAAYTNSSKNLTLPICADFEVEKPITKCLKPYKFATETGSPVELGNAVSNSGKDAQKYALQRIYNLTGGPSWRLRPNNWCDEPCMCRWTGVECRGYVNGTACPAPGTTTVEYLGLENVGMVGQLPKEIEALTDLTDLRLNNNELSGSLNGLGRALKRLEVLKVNQNKFSGRIGDILPTREVFTSTLSSEKRTWSDTSFDDNRISGTLPSWFYPKYDLRLVGNRISGTVPSVVGTAVTDTVRTFTLSRNSLSGTLPEGFSELAQEQFMQPTLAFDNNNFSGTLPASWGRLTHAAVLSVDHNNVSGTLPAAWKTMHQIQKLVLGHNRISGTLPDTWAVLQRMQELSLSKLRLSGTLPAAWAGLGAVVGLNAFAAKRRLLISLAVDQTDKISGTLPAEWSAHADLKFLYLGNNKLSGTIPNDWAQNMAILQVFAAQRNRLQGTIPSALLDNPARCIVVLNDNRLWGRIPRLGSGFYRPDGCTIATHMWTSSTFRPALLLHNNRLSCPLHAALDSGKPADPDKDLTKCSSPPGGDFLKAPSLFNSVLLFGNRLDGNQPGGRLPEWVYAKETGDPMAPHAPFLYLPSGGWSWALGSGILTSAVAYLVSGLVSLGIMVGVGRYLRSRRHRRRATVVSKSDTMNKMVASTHSLITRHLTLYAILSLAIFVPVYISGARYYECGDDVLRSTSTFLADSPGPEMAIAMSMVVMGALSVYTAGAVRLMVISQIASASSEEAPPLTAGKGDPETTAQQGTNVEKEGRRQCADCWYTFSWVKLGCVLFWLIGLVVFAIPSFVYALTLAMPTGDSIFGKEVAPLLNLLRSVTPILITLINVTAVPMLAEFTSERLRWRTAGMLVLARSITTWIVPGVVVIIFGNSCGRAWLGLWQQCSSETLRSQMDVVGPSGGASLQGENSTICFKQVPL